MGLTLPKQNPFGVFVIGDHVERFLYRKSDGMVIFADDPEYISAASTGSEAMKAGRDDPLLLQRPPVTCTLCDRDFITRECGRRHLEDQHGEHLEKLRAARLLEGIEQIMQAASESSTTSSIPTAPSNRSLIEQMKVWGWKHKKNKGDWEVWKSPDGSATVEVRPATQHTGTSAHAINEIIEATGVDADTFWLGPDRDEATEQEKKVTRTSGVSRRVLAVLKQHANAHLDVATITGMIGGDLTADQVQGACSYLVGKGLITAPLRGIYTFDSDDVEHKVGIDINVGGSAPDPDAQSIGKPPSAPSAAPGPPVVPPTPIRPAPAIVVPQKAVDAISDYEINDVLDMLFPSGFKAKHLPAIDRWREATKALIAAIRAD